VVIWINFRSDVLKALFSEENRPVTSSFFPGDENKQNTL